LLVYGVDWAFSMECRYVTHRKRDGRLDNGEFAFSLDNLMPIGIISWYTLQPDEPEALMLASLCRVLRDDRDFMRDYIARADAWRLESGACPRQPSGYAGDISADMPSAEVWSRCADFSARLDQEFAARAAAVLTAAGHTARVNEIGHVSVLSA
jgi:hypothetical protein